MAFEDTPEYRANSLWATSVHESGHILIGLQAGFPMLGFECKFVPDLMVHDAAVHWGEGHAYPEQMKALIGGGAASLLYMKHTLVPPFDRDAYLEGTLAGDLESAQRYFGNSIDQLEFYREFGLRACQLLEPHRDGIQRVAEYIRDTGGQPDLGELERIAREVLDAR